MELATKYKIELRSRILEKILDLKSKIESNEDLPYGPQDFELLVQIDGYLESCLNNWYY